SAPAATAAAPTPSPRLEGRPSRSPARRVHRQRARARGGARWAVEADRCPSSGWGCEIAAVEVGPPGTAAAFVEANSRILAAGRPAPRRPSFEFRAARQLLAAFVFPPCCRVHATRKLCSVA